MIVESENQYIKRYYYLSFKTSITLTVYFDNTFIYLFILNNIEKKNVVFISLNNCTSFKVFYRDREVRF